MYDASLNCVKSLHLGSPITMEYLDRVPFEFTGTIKKIHISYLD